MIGTKTNLVGPGIEPIHDLKLIRLTSKPSFVLNHLSSDPQSWHLFGDCGRLVFWMRSMPEAGAVISEYIGGISTYGGNS